MKKGGEEDDDSKKEENDDDGRKEEEKEDDGKKEDDKSKKKKRITYKIKFIDNYRFTQRKLSALIDNLSGINNKECKSCMERKKIKSMCDFIGFKSNRLNYKCKECGKKMLYANKWSN